MPDYSLCSLRLGGQGPCVSGAIIYGKMNFNEEDAVHWGPCICEPPSDSSLHDAAGQWRFAGRQHCSRRYAGNLLGAERSHL